MCRKFTTFLLALLHLLAVVNVISCQKDEPEVIQKAWSGVVEAMDGIRVLMSLKGSNYNESSYRSLHLAALSECARLYEDTEPRLAKLAHGEDYSGDDAVAWLSAAASSHRSCMDSLEEKGLATGDNHEGAYKNLSMLIQDALAFYGTKRTTESRAVQKSLNLGQNEGLLASWSAASSKADLVVAQDGSGNYKTINSAVDSLAELGDNRPQRVIIYVKSGVYKEKVDIRRELKNIMFVGDGIDKTIVTGDKNVRDGATTFTSATFGVSGDGFWARDMTFENAAGPEKHQAVALRVASDFSLFYKCSIKGYQDTLLVHSLRQFYRDCQIYAQGRQDRLENTGISIIHSRILPAPDLSAVKDQFKTFLGRPWKQYSRTVILKTDLDGLIDPKGWTEWRGDFALSTLYYGEYMNTGNGAATTHRVDWPGFHVIKDSNEANSFAAKNFINGDRWIPATGVPFSPYI
ncbi:hypothetical protein DCAR_0207737 [Daucus carota subsp. sativus]|uniref:Pectinesterase n=1 Tax=Daucus carota subsp. sativus TaxID=79200 RepID=A0AAF1APW2_DAUCS|nr:hypothetical protein DCAR_0207737 [Daucus carota subsp. sativus]